MRRWDARLKHRCSAPRFRACPVAQPSRLRECSVPDIRDGSVQGHTVKPTAAFPPSFLISLSLSLLSLGFFLCIALAPRVSWWYVCSSTHIPEDATMTTKSTGENGIDCRRTTENLAQELSDCEALIKGSLVVNRRRCGNSKCRCARGELHESLAITYKEKGRSVLVHVPKHLETAAQRAIEDYHTLKRLVAAISRMNLGEFREKAKKQRRRQDGKGTSIR